MPITDTFLDPAQLTPEVVAVITDIEGTTSDIAFVHEVLFPYAEAHLPDWLRAHAEEPEVAALIDEVRAEANQPAADLEVVIAILEQWMDADRKASSLKALQGKVWAEGYARGDFTGHVYDDAVATLQAWADDRRALFVYSSGSVAAQKLLFGHSDHGDLTTLFSGYFDTRIGPKKKAASYKAIARELGELPGHLLFLSDIGDAYAADIERLQAQFGYQTWDVIGIHPEHPQKDAMRAKFLDEHTHSEDEVRFFVDGAGLFTLHIGDKVYATLCEADDLISVPAGIHHWFDMGAAPSFKVIRLFNNQEGWVAKFTGTDIARDFRPAGEAILGQ